MITALRHGATTAGARFCGSSDVPLSEEGWAQLWAAVDGAGRDWDRIISSPLQRCAAFAEALADWRRYPCHLEPALQEMHFGDWEGRTAAELMTEDAERLTKFWNDPVRYGPPRAESLRRFEARVVDAWTRISRDYANDNVLLITHGGVIRVILCHLRGLSVARLLELDVPHAQLLELTSTAAPVGTASGTP